MRPIETQYHCKEAEHTQNMFLKSFVDNKAICSVVSRSLHYKNSSSYWKIVSLPGAKS